MIDALADLPVRTTSPHAYACFCASIALITISSGIVYTLLATETISTLPLAGRRQYPGEITTSKVFAGLSFFAGLVATVVAIKSVVNSIRKS